MSQIMTVKGMIEQEKIKGVYAHEHLALNLFRIRKDSNTILDDPFLIAKELKVIKDQINLIIDLSNIVMGRDVEQLQKISNLTNIHIVAATGFYLDEYCEKYDDYSIEELAKIMIDEIENGINNTNIKPGIIGEIAAGGSKISDFERKSLIASALASKKSGLPIYTHSQLGKNGLKVAKLLIEYGVKPEKITIGHLDLLNDLVEIKQILDLGVFIGFDTIGKNEYNSNQNRVNNLLWIINEGYENQILLSQDLTKKTHYKINGGQGFDYLLTSFLPLIKKQTSDEIINKMLLTNPLKFLTS